jgi:hypothetical protein
MSAFTRTNNTIDNAYKSYYEDGVKSVKVEVQITADNKVIVHLDDVHTKRLKQLRNIHKSLVTLEEFLQHTPDDMQVIVEINRYDDRDFAHRVIHFAEGNYSKEVKKGKFVYSSRDKKTCKHIQCMNRAVFHLHDSIDTLDTFYKQIGVSKDILVFNCELLHTYEGVYVTGVTSTEYPVLKKLYPWVKGWIIEPSPVPIILTSDTLQFGSFGPADIQLLEINNTHFDFDKIRGKKFEFHLDLETRGTFEIKDEWIDMLKRADAGEIYYEPKLYMNETWHNVADIPWGLGYHSLMYFNGSTRLIVVHDDLIDQSNIIVEYGV